MALKNNTDIADLMALAASNKAAALSAFQREYQSIPFVLTSDIYSKETCCVDLIENKIVIKSYNFFKKFMNIFGHLVKEIRVEISEFAKFKLATVAKYVSQHCTTLKVLRFTYDEDAGPFEPNVDRVVVMTENPLLITKPFPSVETFHAEKVYVKTHLKMDVCFPKLESLNLMSMVTSDPSLFEVHMENLKKLQFEFAEEKFDDEFDEDGTKMHQIDRSNVKKMIRLNPQLQSIGNDMDVAFLQFLRDNLPSLDELVLHSFDCDDNYRGVDVVFKNIESFYFDLSKMEIMPPVVSESLVRLYAKAGESTFELELTKKHRSIKYLWLDCEYNGAEISQLIADLPHLQAFRLKIEDKEWTSGDVIRLLTECERLQNAHLTINIKSVQQRWRTRFQNQWHIEKKHSTGCYVFLKNVHS